MGRVIHLPKRRKLNISSKENQVIVGDCLEWLEFIPNESIDLCYIDPPFFSNKNYEVIWGNGYELRSFGDRWRGGVQTYIAWMQERVQKIHRVLKPTGSIFLHCDWHASHRLRVMLDDVFGNERFQNELIWFYQTGGASKKHFSRKHDSIFWYSKTVKYNFFPDRIKERRTEKSLQRAENPKGARISINDICKYPNDVFEIPALNPMAKERIGYKTQKPEALLKKLIECTTDKGDIVLDCFGGGGTAASCAAQLNRKFITGDVSPVAVRVICDRLNKLESRPELRVVNVPRTKREWLDMDGHIFADKICEFMGWTPSVKKSNDMGIDGWASNKTIPIQIKNHKNKTGRSDIQKFVGALKGHDIGIFVAWDFASTAWEYLQEVKKAFNKTIEFIKVDEILKDILIDSDKAKEIDELYQEKVS